MTEQQPIWKHNSRFVTVICFIAFYIGRNSFTLKTVFKTLALIMVVFALMHVSGISMEIKASETVLLKIP